MTITTTQRIASMSEVVAEMDRRGKVIEQLERLRDEAVRQRDLAEIKRADTERMFNPSLLKEAEEALAGLLKQWDAFEASYGNQEEAYYKLAKYARPAWDKARAALARLGAAP